MISRTLRHRLAIRAYHRAMHALRDRHRAEFDHLLDRERERVGLYRDGAVDLRLAKDAVGTEGITNQELVS